MVLLLFMFDFVTLTMSTDNVPWSRKSASWEILSLVKVSIIIGVVMVAESFLVLHFLGQMPLKELQTSVFLYLLYSNIFNLLNIREKRNFWNSFPSKVMGLAIIADVVLAFIIASLGIPDIYPLVNPPTDFYHINYVPQTW